VGVRMMGVSLGDGSCVSVGSAVLVGFGVQLAKRSKRTTSPKVILFFNMKHLHYLR
jgi:tetrahydrodipicolinate N-succinyltransferase